MEDQVLLDRFDQYPYRWAHIASYLAGRTDIEVKNRYNQLQRRSQKAIKKKSHQDLPKFPSVDAVLSGVRPPPPPFPLRPSPSSACPRPSNP
jgi:hypothetical protein